MRGWRLEDLIFDALAFNLILARGNQGTGLNDPLQSNEELQTSKVLPQNPVASWSIQRVRRLLLNGTRLLVTSDGPMVWRKESVCIFVAVRSENSFFTSARNRLVPKLWFSWIGSAND